MPTQPLLLVDECLCSEGLLARLRDAGFDATGSRETHGAAASDREVFAEAIRSGRALLTADCADFAELHDEQPNHSGLLFVYQDGDSRDMTWDEIVAATARIAAAYTGSFAGRTIVLNHYRS